MELFPRGSAMSRRRPAWRQSDARRGDPRDPRQGRSPHPEGGRDAAVCTPIGHLPSADAISTDGLVLAKADMDELLRVDTDEWTAEISLIAEHFDRFGAHLPAELRDELMQLAQRLS
jgi:hypothetical protein